MSNTYGLAKKATAVAVRVLDRKGRGTTGAIIAGISWVAAHQKPGKSIANMSLGGSKSIAINIAVDISVSKGVHFVVAAGNDYLNACNYSPASATRCVTVGATNRYDWFSVFSNYGICVDILAPGTDITSLWLNGGTRTISGTSMASPHVAGVMAKYLTYFNLTPPKMKGLLLSTASRNKISGVPPYTRNLVVFKRC